MFWVAWKGYNNGQAVSLGEVAQLQAESYGMHGYPTAAEAEANPNSVSALEKIFVNAQIKASNPEQAASNAASGAANTAASAAGVTGLTGFLGDITSANLWIRVGKVILGGVLILIAVAKMTDAGGIAAKAVKMAPLL